MRATGREKSVVCGLRRRARSELRTEVWRGARPEAFSMIELEKDVRSAFVEFLKIVGVRGGSVPVNDGYYGCHQGRSGGGTGDVGG